MHILDAYAGHQDADGHHGFSKAFAERGHKVTSTDIGQQFGCDITGDITDPDVWAEIIRRGPYDGVLAGPPCEGFSMAAVRHSFTCRGVCVCGEPLQRASGEKWVHLGAGWNPDCKPKPVPDSLTYTPKSKTGAISLMLAQRTIVLAAVLRPKWWVMENPKALLRQLPFMRGLDRVSIDQCQYGNVAQKPTDLWGVFPEGWAPRPRCKASRYTFVDAQGNTIVPRLNDKGKIDKHSFDTTPYRPNPDGTPCHEAGYRGSTFGTQGKANATMRAVIPHGLSLDLCLAAEGEGRRAGICTCTGYAGSDSRCAVHG